MCADRLIPTGRIFDLIRVAANFTYIFTSNGSIYILHRTVQARTEQVLFTLRLILLFW